MPASTLPENDRWKLVAYVKSLSEGAESPSQSPSAARLANIAPVRYEDILASGQDRTQWLTYSGSYDGHRFSSNDQISKKNVSNLQLVWMRQYSSESRSRQAHSLSTGFMFITTPPNQVEALDAKSGELIWTYDRKLPQHPSAVAALSIEGSRS